MKIFLVIIFLHLTDALFNKLPCDLEPLCSCRRYIDMFDIDCANVTRFEPVINLLKPQFANIIVNELNFKEGCSLKSLPDFAFRNNSVRIFNASCPFSDIPADAFTGVNSLTEISLSGTVFSTIPVGLSDLKFIKALNLRNSNFSSLHGELRNLTSIVSIDFSGGILEDLSKDVFVGTPNIKFVNLSYNNLRYLHPDTLKPLKFLQEIYLRGNQIAGAAGLFGNPNLQVIDLYENKILSLENAFPEDLWSMKELYIGKNPLEYINSSIFGFKFRQLKVIDISDTVCANVDEKIFHFFPYIEKVFLGGNLIGELPKTLFHNLEFLKTVDLTFNNVTSVEGLFQNNPKIKYLFLAINSISDISNSFHGLIALKKLNLSRNFIEYIDHRSFMGLEKLRFVDLSHNKIKVIESNSFSGLPKLKVLDLSFNVLENLNKSVQNLSFLKTLRLDSTNLQDVSCEEFIGLTRLSTLSLQDNRITSLNGCFGKLYRLNSLNISANGLKTLSRDTFPEEMNSFDLSLSKNKWECDCRLTWILEWLGDKANFSLLDNPVCHSPVRLKGKFLKDLTMKDITEWTEDCPNQCDCECATQGRNFHVRVNCSSRNLARIPSALPRHLGNLDMSGNELEELGEFFHDFYSSLSVLDLENNRISNLDGNLIPKDLKELKLSGNLLKRLPWKKLLNDSLEVMTLSENPWCCDCETVDFKKWLLSVNRLVVDVNETRCGNGDETLPELYGKVIISLSDNDLCPSIISLYVAIAIAFLGFFLLATSSVLAYSKYRLYIKIWLYAHGITWVKEDDTDMEKIFDAVLSYSPMDEIFVLTAIAPGLEEIEPKFKLCIPDRDIVSGVFSVVTTMKAVQDSKRIIVILDRDYINDEFCMTIFRIAFQQSLEDKINRLVVIKVGDIPASEVVDPDLKVTLESIKCVAWGETLFWEKLRFAMPKKMKRLSMRRNTIV